MKSNRPDLVERSVWCSILFHLKALLKVRIFSISPRCERNAPLDHIGCLFSYLVTKNICNMAINAAILSQLENWNNLKVQMFPPALFKNNNNQVMTVITALWKLQSEFQCRVILKDTPAQGFWVIWIILISMYTWKTKTIEQ